MGLEIDPDDAVLLCEQLQVGANISTEPKAPWSRSSGDPVPKTW